MPPSIILEILKITEAEMDLRELTRELHQARRALRTAEYVRSVKPLAKEQVSLTDRTDAVVEAIRELDDGESEFANEIALLEQVAEVMDEASRSLRKNDTGPVAVAAETEAIELLLQARRSNGGGGGGGNSPGGGRKAGSTNLSALALVGRGDEPGKVERRDVSQTTGKTVDEVPAEFRSALDRYFSGLDRK